MDRRAFIVSITGSHLAAPLGAKGQQGGKVSRVGICSAVRPRVGSRRYRKGSEKSVWWRGRPS